MLSPLYMWMHSHGNMFSDICISKETFGSSGECVGWSVLHCTGTCLLQSSWMRMCFAMSSVENELPFLFMVCLLSLSHFAGRGDGACIDHSIAVIVPQGLKVTVSFRSAQERSRHPDCFYIVTQSWWCLIEKSAFLLCGVDIVSPRNVKR